MSNSVLKLPMNSKLGILDHCSWKMLVDTLQKTFCLWLPVGGYKSCVCFGSLFYSYSQTSPVLPEVTFCDLVFNIIFNVRFYIYLNSEGEHTSLTFCKLFQDQWLFLVCCFWVVLCLDRALFQWHFHWVISLYLYSCVKSGEKMWKNTWKETWLCIADKNFIVWGLIAILWDSFIIWEPGL